jgi:hypothetical protein
LSVVSLFDPLSRTFNLIRSAFGYFELNAGALGVVCFVWWAVAAISRNATNGWAMIASHNSKPHRKDCNALPLRDGN